MVKESDVIATVSSEFSRLGARAEPSLEGMVIHGGRPLSGTEVDSHFDHRLAMSLAVATLIAKGEITMKHAEVAQVSCFAFWQPGQQALGTGKSSRGMLNARQYRSTEARDRRIETGSVSLPSLSLSG